VCQPVGFVLFCSAWGLGWGLGLGTQPVFAQIAPPDCIPSNQHANCQQLQAANIIKSPMVVFGGCAGNLVKVDIDYGSFEDLVCTECPDDKCEACFTANNGAIKLNGIAPWNQTHANLFGHNKVGEVETGGDLNVFMRSDEDYLARNGQASSGNTSNKKPIRFTCQGCSMLKFNTPKKIKIMFRNHPIGMPNNSEWDLSGNCLTIVNSPTRKAPQHVVVHEFGHALGLGEAPLTPLQTAMDASQCLQWTGAADGEALLCMYTQAYSCCQ
jgi:hypothetical protein